MRSQVASSISSGFIDDPHDEDEQPPDVAACFMASKSIGFRTLSSEMANGWLILSRSWVREAGRKGCASVIFSLYQMLRRRRRRPRTNIGVSRSRQKPVSQGNEAGCE